MGTDIAKPELVIPMPREATMPQGCTWDTAVKRTNAPGSEEDPVTRPTPAPERVRRFQNRREAGSVLARCLVAYSGLPDVLVLGLPRGGVPVAYEVAGVLSAPLDVFLVRKLGVPGHAELAMGALADGGVRVLNDDVLSELHIPADVVERTTNAERQELERRQRRYRGDRAPLPLQGKTVILIDDGAATGSTIRAAALAARRQNPSRLVLALPVAPPSARQALRSVADAVVCVITPEEFTSVGEWYVDFAQTTDEEVTALLATTGQGSGHYS